MQYSNGLAHRMSLENHGWNNPHLIRISTVYLYSIAYPNGKYKPTWLNQERWEDELVIAPKKEKISKEWMFSNEGIEAKARELGIMGNGYDTYASLKAKCMNKLGMSVQ